MGCSAPHRGLCLQTASLCTRHAVPGHARIPDKGSPAFPQAVHLALPLAANLLSALCYLLDHWPPAPWPLLHRATATQEHAYLAPITHPPSLPAAPAQAARFMDACAHGGMVCCEVELMERVLQLWKDEAADISLKPLHVLQSVVGLRLGLRASNLDANSSDFLARSCEASSPPPFPPRGTLVR